MNITIDSLNFSGNTSTVQ